MKNNFLAYGIYLILLLLFTFSLCSCTSVQDTLYLQNVTVKGPLNQPPINHAERKDSKNLQITPRIFVNNMRILSGQIEGHTLVNSKGIFQVDTIQNDFGDFNFIETRGANSLTYEGRNLEWLLPEFSVGVDLDYLITANFAFNFGLNISQISQTSLYGWRAGIGLNTAKGNYGIRFDAGLIWQDYMYEANTVLVREYGYRNEREVYFLFDRETTTNFNHYFSLNISYLNPYFPLNPFVNLSYTKQTILDLEASELKSFELIHPNYSLEDMRGKANVSFLILTPGVYFDFNDWNRLTFAARFYYGSGIENSSGGSFITPTLQIGFRL